MIATASFDPENLPFPTSLPEFQRLFPDDAACAAYLESIRWRQGFVCMWCGERGEPFRISTRPHVLRCRKCRKDNSLIVGTVMERTHTPLSIWFWGAYLASSLTPGLSAVQFQRQLAPSYATLTLRGTHHYDGLYTGSWHHANCSSHV